MSCKYGYTQTCRFTVVCYVWENHFFSLFLSLSSLMLLLLLFSCQLACMCAWRCCISSVCWWLLTLWQPPQISTPKKSQSEKPPPTAKQQYLRPTKQEQQQQQQQKQEYNYMEFSSFYRESSNCLSRQSIVCCCLLSASISFSVCLFFFPLNNHFLSPSCCPFFLSDIDTDGEHVLSELLLYLMFAPIDTVTVIFFIHTGFSLVQHTSQRQKRISLLSEALFKFLIRTERKSV